jgi:hypothetical protein
MHFCRADEQSRQERLAKLKQTMAKVEATSNRSGGGGSGDANGMSTSLHNDMFTSMQQQSNNSLLMTQSVYGRLPGTPFDADADTPAQLFSTPEHNGNHASPSTTQYYTPPTHATPPVAQPRSSLLQSNPRLQVCAG